MILSVATAGWLVVLLICCSDLFKFSKIGYDKILKILRRMAVPTKRDRATLVKVVNLCLRTPGKMMMKARKRVKKTM